AVVFVWTTRAPRPGPPVAQAPGTGARWAVECISGSLQIEEESVTDRGLLAAGQRLATEDGSRARVAIGDIGEVELEPNSRVRLVGVTGDEHRLALERGTMRAFIWAPPRQFVVETPSAIATDLGCSYLLAVDERGAGRIEVTSGWVAFEHEGRESFVPADAVCRTEPVLGPGTPHYADAPPELVAALGAFDFLDLDDERKRAALRKVLTTARRADAFTLWHLLTRAPADQRDAVYDALFALVRPPTGVTRAGVARGDRVMLDLWWNSLGLGEADWWRMWEGPAPGSSGSPGSPGAH
ncbi:MAG: FecR domain-containing protein, partial [Candidatus Eiseniibacteriota bacterium]